MRRLVIRVLDELEDALRLSVRGHIPFVKWYPKEILKAKFAKINSWTLAFFAALCWLT